MSQTRQSWLVYSCKQRRRSWMFLLIKYTITMWCDDERSIISTPFICSNYSIGRMQSIHHSVPTWQPFFCDNIKPIAFCINYPLNGSIYQIIFPKKQKGWCCRIYRLRLLKLIWKFYTNEIVLSWFNDPEWIRE